MGYIVMYNKMLLPISYFTNKKETEQWQLYTSRIDRQKAIIL